MSQYSTKTKQQMNTWYTTFSHILDSQYSSSFTDCKMHDQDCDAMENQLGSANDILENVKNLDHQVKSHVDAQIKKITKVETELADNKKVFIDTTKILNAVDNIDNASETLRKNKKTSMRYEYFSLAYYVLTDILITYMLHKQYGFSVLYFLMVFLIILVVIFVLGWMGIPYS